MKIELSRYSGFCMGVRDAILKIVSEINGAREDIYVHGPLIHNPQTTAILDKRGLKTVDDDAPIKDMTVAIRTHGLPYGRIKEIKRDARRVINLTCPRVARVQGIIKKYSQSGCFTLIAGDDDHAEVIGLKSFAGAGVRVIARPEDTADIPERDRYIVVSQTTFDLDVFERIIRALEERFPGRLHVINTICDSTYNRQKDVLEAIGRGMEVLVVVGGKNSANTRRLANLGRENGVRTFHIETGNELKEDDFRREDRVFVTAGASTPGWIINNVLEKLYSIQFGKSNAALNFLKKFMEFTVRTNVISSVATYFISLYAQRRAGLPPDPVLAMVSSFYLFAMYTINNYFMMEFLKESNPYKLSLYRRYRKALIPLSFTLVALSFFAISRYDWTVIAVFAGSTLLGVSYSTRPFKKIVSLAGIAPVTRLYHSRNVIAATGWVIVSTIVPLIAGRAPWCAVLPITVFIYCLLFFRNILLDLIAFQGDLILGRETLPIQLGIGRTKLLLAGMSACAFIVFGTHVALTGPYVNFIMLGVIAYYLGALALITGRDYLIALKYEILVDFNLLLFIALYSVISSLS